jgi:2-methylcitrate dehydratase PrpD
MTKIKSDQLREETRSAVERIGTFAAASRWEDLTGDVRRLFKRNILDCLGCAIAALPDSPFQALREQRRLSQHSPRHSMTHGARFRAQTSDPHARYKKKKCQKQLTLSPAQPSQ